MKLKYPIHKTTLQHCCRLLLPATMLSHVWCGITCISVAGRYRWLVYSLAKVVRNRKTLTAIVMSHVDMVPPQLVTRYVITWMELCSCSLLWATMLLYMLLLPATVTSVNICSIAWWTCSFIGQQQILISLDLYRTRTEFEMACQKVFKPGRDNIKMKTTIPRAYCYILYSYN